LSCGTRQEWIVLLEAVATDEAGIIDRPGLERMLASWPCPAPTTLFSESRYALQLPVRAVSPPAALSYALCLWEDAVRVSRLPLWHLVRAEVVTPQELTRELVAAEGELVAPNGSQDRRRTECNVVGDDLLRRALHDDVTDLPGREVFLDEVRRRLASSLAGSVVDAVIVIRVDIGPATRHDPGAAELLVAVAAALVQTVRADDRVARIGPGHFAVLVTAPSESLAGAVAQRLVRRARRSSPPGGGGVRSTARRLAADVGLATTGRGGDAEDLVLRAESAAEAARAEDADYHAPLPGDSEASRTAVGRADRGRCGVKRRITDR
jgi:GGDEF domain-containing protein